MIQKNFIKMYEESFSNNFDLPALSDYTSDTSYTYGEMARQIARLHLLYEAAGVKKGDKIAVFGKNSSNWCVGFMSVISYGAVSVPVLADFKPSDAHTIINHSDSVMLLVDSQTMKDLSEKEMKNVASILSLDDFGSGLSSFAYLKNLPVRYLKIDGMFVRDIVDDPIDHAMVKSINEIGQLMGMKTIAEFVENDDIKQKVAEIGVNYVQGHGIGSPRPFEELVKEWTTGIENEKQFAS